MSSIALPTLSDDRSLAAYLREIRSFPYLTNEEEFMLAQRWREHGDIEAAHRLVTSHLRLVVKIAAQYRKFSMPFADLIAEGNIGLMKAVRKFDPEKGCRLATYAMWWIKGQITEFILKSWSLVRMGSFALQKQLFFGLQDARKRLSRFDDGSFDPELEEKLAAEFGTTPEEVGRMGNRFEHGDVSLDRPATTFDDGDGETGLDRLFDDRPGPEDRVAAAETASQRRRLIETALTTLSDRDRAIIEARWLDDERVTLDTLGQRFGVSRERIRQLEARALKKLRSGILEQLGGEGGADTGAALLAV